MATQLFFCYIRNDLQNVLVKVKWEEKRNRIEDTGIGLVHSKLLRLLQICLGWKGTFHPLFWSWKSKIRASVSGECPLSGLQVAIFLLCPHLSFPQDLNVGKDAPSYRKTNALKLGTHPYDLIYP